MGDYYGYLILAVFAVIFIGISVFVSKKFPIEGVDDFVAAGRGIPSSLVAASVMVSWVWTTTIMGAAEAGMSFGISGGLNYAWGNSIPFFVLIPLVLVFPFFMGAIGVFLAEPVSNIITVIVTYICFSRYLKSLERAEGL